MPMLACRLSSWCRSSGKLKKKLMHRGQDRKLSLLTLLLLPWQGDHSGAFGRTSTPFHTAGTAIYKAAQTLARDVCAQILHTPFICLLIMQFSPAPDQQRVSCRQLVKAVLSKQKGSSISPAMYHIFTIDSGMRIWRIVWSKQIVPWQA